MFLDALQFKCILVPPVTRVLFCWLVIVAYPVLLCIKGMHLI